MCDVVDGTNLDTVVDVVDDATSSVGGLTDGDSCDGLVEGEQHGVGGLTLHGGDSSTANLEWAACARDVADSTSD